MGTAQASGVALAAAARAGLPVAPVHPQRGQGGGHRQRSRRQGAGHRDGHPGAAARRRAPTHRCRRRPGPGDLPRLARRGPGPAGRGTRRTVPTAELREVTVIASVRGRVVALTPSTAVRRGRRGRHRRCSAPPARSPALRLGDRGHAGHVAGGARGLADAVRLRRRRRAVGLRAAADRQRRRPASWRRRCSRCTRPTRCAGRWPTEDLASAHPGARHRPQGCPADRARAQGPARCSRREHGLAPRSRRGSAARRGAAAWRDQVHTGLVGLGWSGREADAAVDAVAPLADEQQDRPAAPTSPVLLRAALRTLSRA